MRTPCPYCALKHIGQAIVLWSEAGQGYPNHKWLALGHLAEASDELSALDSALSTKLREQRKGLEVAQIPQDVDAAQATAKALEDLMAQVALLTGEAREVEGPRTVPHKRPRPITDPNDPNCPSCIKKAAARRQEEQNNPEIGRAHV
jgi:hypothetical protein